MGATPTDVPGEKLLGLIVESVGAYSSQENAVTSLVVPVPVGGAPDPTGVLPW